MIPNSSIAAEMEIAHVAFFELTLVSGRRYLSSTNEKKINVRVNVR